MKALIALLATAAFMAPAFAADAPPVPMTKADCEKTLDMNWDATTKACLQRSASGGASDGTGSKTSDRTPETADPDRSPGATGAGAAGTDAGQTPTGTSDRTPAK
jgi:hypothetical protein